MDRKIIISQGENYNSDFLAPFENADLLNKPLTYDEISTYITVFDDQLEELLRAMKYCGFINVETINDSEF